MDSLKWTWLLQWYISCIAVTHVFANTGEQVDQDSGDLISFGNEPHSRFTVKAARWSSVNFLDSNCTPLTTKLPTTAFRELITKKLINVCSCINNVFWPLFMYAAHTFPRKAFREPKHQWFVLDVYANVYIYLTIWYGEAFLGNESGPVILNSW